MTPFPALFGREQCYSKSGAAVRNKIDELLLPFRLEFCRHTAGMDALIESPACDRLDGNPDEAGYGFSIERISFRP